MRLIVTDANIIIDMDAGNLLEEMFRLPGVDFCIPDILYIEELSTNYGALPGLGLTILGLAPKTIGYTVELRRKYRRPSSNDLLALALAQVENCPLLTGDGPLREAAIKESVEVHGTIWLTEQLLQAKIVSVSRVSAAYEAMKRDGSRLPWPAVKAQLKRWSEAGTGSGQKND